MTESKYVYGWRPDKPDFRDHKFFNLLAPNVLPGGIDLRPKCPPIYDQGQLGSCFHPDTKISLLDGTVKTLKELYELKESFWIYSCDIDGKIVPGKAICNLTGKDKELIKITLDNGKEEICTPDHEFMLRNGEYKKAKDLLTNDSLMPLYKKINRFGYEEIFDNLLSKYIFTHWMTCDEIYPIEVKEKNIARHHKNQNPLDNRPENLQILDMKEHFLHHSKLYNGTEEQSINSKRTILKQYEDNPNWNEGAAEKGGTKSIQNRKENGTYEEFVSYLELGHSPESREKARLSIIETLSSPEKRKELSIRSKKQSVEYLSNPENEKKLKSVMKENGKKSGRYKIVLWAKNILDEYGDLTERIWNEYKENCGLHNFSKYSTIFKHFNSLEDLKLAAINRNHKIKSIEFLKETSDVYCLTVEKYHNFALESGIFVHNCTANAIAGAVDFDLMKQGHAPISPSRLFIYFHERVLENTVNSDAGAEIRDGIKTINTKGVCHESLWPYDISKFKICPPSEAYADATNFTALAYKSVDNTNISALKSVLAQGFPIVCGISVYESFESAYVAQTGIVPMPGPNENLLGGHCVDIVGYSDNSKTFIMRNSWGLGWGLNGSGYFTIPYAYLTNINLASDFWVVTQVK